VPAGVSWREGECPATLPICGRVFLSGSVIIVKFQETVPTYDGGEFVPLPVHILQPKRKVDGQSPVPD
jgi:hypothetical protein